ncbi:hypothetical protein [Fulvivirga sp.]|uniref:hypothetical protein n=1 Tax=Fulvivirga sp. TaxID=1931237 RepID=UPI0032EFC791
MTNLSDKEIQELLEKGKTQSFDNNEKLYSKVFDALKAEPDFELSKQFSSNVIASIEAKSDSTEKVIYVIGVLGILVSFALTLALIVAFAGDSMLKYLPHLLISSVVLLLVQYLDNKVQHLVTGTK